MQGVCKMQAQQMETGLDQKVEKIIAAYREKPGALIPVLHEIQNELGHLPMWVQQRVSNAMNIPLSEVNSIISFYALFSEKPKGKYVIGVCKGTACYVRGADKIVEQLQELLGIEAGDTTPDGMFTIEVVRCLGACGLGPVITVNDTVYTRMKPDKTKKVITDLIEKTGKGG
jgi:NADH:ubiquinone oxidoreductase subunit E